MGLPLFWEYFLLLWLVNMNIIQLFIYIDSICTFFEILLQCMFIASFTISSTFSLYATVFFIRLLVILINSICRSKQCNLLIVAYNKSSIYFDECVCVCSSFLFSCCIQFFSFWAYLSCHLWHSFTHSCCFFFLSPGWNIPYSTELSVLYLESGKKSMRNYFLKAIQELHTIDTVVHNWRKFA